MATDSSKPVLEYKIYLTKIFYKISFIIARTSFIKDLYYKVFPSSIGWHYAYSLATKMMTGDTFATLKVCVCVCYDNCIVTATAQA